MYNLKELLAKKDYDSITKKVGNLLSKSIDFLNSIDNINNDEKLNTLITNFYEENEILKQYTGNKEELLEALKFEFISTIPRKYCIQHNKDKISGSHFFPSIKKMLELSPELEKYKYLIEPHEFYLGYKSKKRIFEKYKKIIELKLNNNPLNFYTTENKTKINDLSNILFDVINQNKKRIYLLDEGTGSGKSYSINQFAIKAMLNKYYHKKINYIIYITDRKNNVKQEYLEMIEANPEIESICLEILSNEDCILEHIDELEKFPEILRTPDFDHLIKWAKNYKKEKSSDTKEIFNKYEMKYRKFLKDFLEKEFKKPSNKIVTYKDKIEFLEKNYSEILKVYTNILIKNKKILYINIDKFYLQIDTIIEKEIIVLHQNSSILKDSVIILDESDAAAEKLLDKIIDETLLTKIDLIEKVILFNNALEKKKLGKEYKREDIEKSIEIIQENFEKLQKKFYIFYNISFKTIEDLNSKRLWLFILNNTFIQTPKSSNNLMMKLDNKAEKVFLEKPLEDNIDYTKFNDFIELLTTVYRQCLILLKKMIKIEQDKSDNISPLIAAKRVLNNLFYSSDQKSRDGIIKDILAISNKECNDNKSDDFYLNPGSIVDSKIEDEESENIKINAFNISTTPENILLKLIENGAYVFMSSATAKNKSKFKNFNLDWEFLKEQIYEESDHAKKLAKNYREEREKYIKNIILEIKECVDKNIENDEELLKEEILNHFENKEDIIELLEKIKNQTIKENDNNDIEYRIRELYKVIIDCLYKIKKNSIANLVLLKFDIKKKSNEIIENIEKILSIYNKNIAIFSSNAPNLTETIELYRDAVYNDKITFLFTTYAAAEKGYNFKVKINKNKYPNCLIPINDLGIKELNENDDIYVDLSGVYLGDITCIEPSINTTENINNEIENTKSILKAIYYTNALYRDNLNAITEVTEEIFSNKPNNYPFTNAAKNNPQLYEDLNNSIVASLLATTQQATGRAGRCNIRFKYKYISLNNNIINKAKNKSCNIDELISEETKNKQSYEVREVLDFIKEKIEGKENNKLIAGAVKESNDIYKKALIENNNGNPELLKSLQQGLNKLFITKKEYESLDKNIKKFYIPSKGFLQKGYSHDSCEEDEYGNKNVEKIYKAEEKKYNVSFKALNLSEEQIKILNKNNIRIDKKGELDGYIMLPRGFDSLRGNIGEILTEKYFEEHLDIKLEELPDEIYEKMDHIKVFDNFILTVDSKYYTIHSKIYDNEEEQKEKYQKKLSEIQKYYHGKKVIGIMFNVKDNKTTIYKTVEHPPFDDGNKMLTVPNIYNKNGKIDVFIIDQIMNFINKEN